MVWVLHVHVILRIVLTVCNSSKELWLHVRICLVSLLTALARN